jgi:hypothetical protein
VEQGLQKRHQSEAVAEPFFSRDFMAAPAPAGEMVVLNVPTNTYLRLDRSAARIYLLLESEQDPDRAASALAVQFGIPLEQAVDDVSLVIDSVRRLEAGKSAGGRRPTGRGAARVLRKWWRLPASLKLRTVQAATVVVVAEVGLRTMDLARLSRLMGVPLTDVAGPPAQSGQGRDGLSEREREASWAVAWVLPRWTHDDTCLRQALAVGFFLRRRHPVLRLGLIEDGRMAHAWIEMDGFSYNAVPTVGTFSASAAPPAPAGPAS